MSCTQKHLRHISIRTLPALCWSICYMLCCHQNRAWSVKLPSNPVWLIQYQLNACLLKNMIRVDSFVNLITIAMFIGDVILRITCSNKTVQPSAYFQHKYNCLDSSPITPTSHFVSNTNSLFCGFVIPFVSVSFLFRYFCHPSCFMVFIAHVFAFIFCLPCILWSYFSQFLDSETVSSI